MRLADGQLESVSCAAWSGRGVGEAIHIDETFGLPCMWKGPNDNELDARHLINISINS